MTGGSVKREVIATPLFKKNLQAYLDSYVELGAVRFVERIRLAYLKMVETIPVFEDIGVVRRRNVKGKTVTLREYVLAVEPRDFLILYRIPPEAEQPLILLNIRIGGQNRFKWK